MSTAQRPPRGDAPRPQPAVTAEILDRQPPFNLEAETGVLGSIMLNPDVCDDVTMLVRVDDFYDDANRKLYEHMMGMHDEGQKLDMTLLVERLKRAGDFERIGGTHFLAKTFQSVPNYAHAVYYAKIVREKATFRALIDRALSVGGSFYLTYHRFARRDQIEAAYPQFADFLRRKRTLDPDLRFQSDWWRHHDRLFSDAR